ncbi:MAG: helix-turn-helix transcriptional regulator [Alphaproteobacteria bacterium]|nr:helix-turn-helix transcriptional regulator [Alphaproteobacteria bacterium]
MIHSNVKVLMKAKKINTATLSAEISLDESIIKKSRSGNSIESCTIGSLNKIAKALDVEIDDLFDVLEIEENTNVEE